MEQLLWVEKFRPNTIKDCILPDRLKDTFQEFVNKKEIPNLLLCGGAGVGKTTVAKALCTEVGCDFMFLNGSDENGIDVLRTKIKSYASSMSLNGGRKVIIIDEADYMNANSLQPALRGAIEEFIANCSFVFTCNFQKKIIQPIHSRCTVIDFKLNKNEKAQMAAKFFVRIQQILNNENIQYDKAVVANLIQKYFPDYRRTLNELQRYSSKGNIDEGILAQIGELSLNELIGYLKSKDFGKIRKWVGENSDSDASNFYRDLYDISFSALKTESIPQIILILAKYQYQESFVADSELNRLACLVEILVDCEWK